MISAIYGLMAIAIVMVFMVWEQQIIWEIDYYSN